MKPLSLLLFLFLLPWSLSAAPVPYSGKVAINGLNFQGDAQFTFALRDANGTVHWRNGVDADSSVTLNVDRGLYVCLLGGHTMNDFPPNLFLENPELFLVVHFFRLDTGEWLHLQPDQRITSAPHALAADVAGNAFTADAVKPGAITKSMLAAEVLADLNASVVLPEQNATIQTGSITRSMLAPGVLSDLNATIAPGSITAGQLAPALLADLNRSVVITRSMLPESVLADLNRTIVITRDMLPGDVLADLNGTIPRSRLAADVLTDLNRTFTISPGTVTEGMLAAGTVTPNKLSTEVVAALKPAILQQPQSVTAVSGTSATFTTEATGGNLTYQWLQQGYAIAGGNGNVLTITDLNATLHDGNYSVTVTNAFGSTTSAVATLDVNGSVTQGLVGWWKFDESNGTVANDSSGNNRNGSLTGFDSNTTQWVQGKVGGALQFDGTDDYVNINGYKGILGSSPRTMVAWIKTTKVESSIMSWGNHNSAQKWSFPIKTDKLRVEAYNGSIVGTNEVTDDQWHHVGSVLPTGTNNINQMLFYLDGVAEPHSEISNMVINTVASQDVRIGGLDFNSRYFQGLIDDVRIYDRALTAAEVAALYTLASGNAPTTTTTGDGTTIVADSGPVTTEKMADGAVTTAKLSESILKYLRPEITTSPQAPGLVFGGQSVTLSGAAEGKYLTYQWNRNGQPVAGATGATLVIADVNGTLHDGNYTLVVSNDFGSVTSSPTSLQVDATPTNHSVASIGMQMIFCPPGTFTMGSPSSETGRGSDETQHSVTLTNGFYLGKYELTQAQYETVMNGNPEGLNAKPSQWPNNDDRPVEKVSWEDAQVFLSRLNSIEQTAGRLPNGWKYVLPTEAEWEYACRAGTSSAYSWGNDINSSHANWNYGNDANQTVNVGQYAANPWGFYDMHGNVWEWVHDWKANYPGGAQTNPEGPASGSNRAIRGGSWGNTGSHLRSAKRNNYGEGGARSDYVLGFRVGFKAISADEANPELELFGGAGITREAGQPWAEPGVAAHDARDGNLTASVTVSGTVDVNSTGTYVLTYTVADAAGNEVNATRTVTVSDTTDPVVTLLGDANVTHAKDVAWVDPGATASDTLDGNLTNQVTITGAVDVNSSGAYVLTYSVSDGAGNDSNVTRVVNVVGIATTHVVDLNATVAMQMLWVEPGTFTMGSPTNEAGRITNEAEHNVTLTKGFYLGKYEVTQAQYQAVMTGNTNSLSTTPSQYSGNERPVENVSWDDAQIFLARLNATEQTAGRLPAGWSYVLPTESEWEYASRAGTTTAYSWGATIATTNANYEQSGINQTRDVGQYAANPWGFFDMHGNVGEWTADWYQSAYPSGTVPDPTGPASGSLRVWRGGSWGAAGAYLRSAGRNYDAPGGRSNGLGFRVGFKFTGEHSVDLNASVAMQMLWVEPGTFTMGSPTTESGRGTNEAEHNVTLTKGFYLGKYEVTQAQYQAVMTGNTNSLSTTPSQYTGNDRPVEKVSWDDVQIFLTRLNAAEQTAGRLPAGWSYVLPTESEWEYACRAGTTTTYSWGSSIAASNANYDASGINQTRDVGQYAANPWGFFDMHGNVWEWTADRYQSAYPTGNVTDPTGPASGSNRVKRGGSWGNDGYGLRSAKRKSPTPVYRSNNLGFRVGFKASQ